MRVSVSPAEAARALREGRVALVPTETVVGLVAAEPGLESATVYAVDFLASLYWPGPLTLVLDRVEGGTVGVRVPAGPVVQELLAAYGEPLYATSANLSGKPAPRGLEEVDPRVSEAVDVVVGGEAGSGEASAVVDLSGGRVRLLRATGDLSNEKLAGLARD